MCKYIDFGLCETKNSQPENKNTNNVLLKDRNTEKYCSNSYCHCSSKLMDSIRGRLVQVYHQNLNVHLARTYDEFIFFKAKVGLFCYKYHI